VFFVIGFLIENTHNSIHEDVQGFDIENPWKRIAKK
jgi:hypothetical protein